MSKKTHNRILGISGASLTKRRLPSSLVSTLSKVRDEIEQVMKSSEYLRGAPFEWITISVRFGIVNQKDARIGHVNPQWGDLPIAIEVNTDDIFGYNDVFLKRKLALVVSRAIFQAGEKYCLANAGINQYIETLVLEDRKGGGREGGITDSW